MFVLGNSDKWLLFAVHPAPQTWHRKRGIIIIMGRARYHGNDSQVGQGGFGGSLCRRDGPPINRREVHSGRAQVGRHCKSDSFFQSVDE